MDPPHPEEPSWPVENGNAIRRQAKRALGHAVYLHQFGAADAEQKAREALALAASATYWLEDTVLDEVAHEELDRYGKIVRETFPEGCVLNWTGTSYEHRCPVRIAHKRLGFSIGFIAAKRSCSICGGDLSECEHLPGQTYDVPGGAGPAGSCRVCNEPDCSKHLPEEMYRARVVSIITEIEELQEVSLVAKPQQPDARLLALPVDTEALTQHLGSDFRPGMRVNCNQCLEPCQGFESFDPPSGELDLEDRS